MRTLILALSSCLLVTAAQAQDGLDETQSVGKERYARMCAPCHNKGFWAANRIAFRSGEEYALLDKRSDLNADYIRQAVRVGIGSMPPYRKTELSDSDLAAITAYLTRSRGKE